jgi:hypothetical protein
LRLPACLLVVLEQPEDRLDAVFDAERLPLPGWGVPLDARCGVKRLGSHAAALHYQ